jgi:hypothetical protein
MWQQNILPKHPVFFWQTTQFRNPEDGSKNLAVYNFKFLTSSCPSCSTYGSLADNCNHVHIEDLGAESASFILRILWVLSRNLGPEVFLD